MKPIELYLVTEKQKHKMSKVIRSSQHRLGTMKPESKFWQQVKKNTPKIKWTRLESWTVFWSSRSIGISRFLWFFYV
jgi:hypothetical protein